MADKLPGDGNGRVALDSRSSWYILGLLTFSYALAYVDRQMLNLLVDPIKQSLDISDTRFSLVQGTAFVVAYMVAAPVFGRLVDIANRKAILMFGVCAWSVFTMFCGLADSYAELFLARMGVGVTEACIFPVAMSLLGDSFTPKRMDRAMSIFLLGVQMGGGFSLVAGGLIIAFAATLTYQLPVLANLETWQMAFVVVGVPGILFVLLLLTMPEPERRRNPAMASDDHKMPMREVLSHLWAQRGFYGRIYMTIGAIGVVQLGIPSWFPAFMIRAHGLPMATTGLQLGIISLIIGTIGTLSGPAVSAWLLRRGHVDAPLRAAAFSTIGMFAACIAIPLAPGATGGLVAAAAAVFFCGFPIGIIGGATTNATASRMRGVVASIYTFTAQLIGYMIGPTLVALLTDNVFEDPGLVGRSMQIVWSIASLVAGLLLFSVLPHYRRLVGQMMAEPRPTEKPGAAAAT